MTLQTRGLNRSRRRLSCWLTTLIICAAAVTLLPSCGPDTSTPKNTALTFAKAVMAGDMDTVHKTATGTDAQFAAVKTFSDVVAAMRRYEEAAMKKFGDEGKLSREVNKDLAEEVDAAEEKIEGDTATLINKKNPAKRPMKLKKDAGGWKVDLSNMEKDEEMARIKAMGQAEITVLDTVARGIEEGKYKTIKEANEARGSAMFSAMAGANK